MHILAIDDSKVVNHQISRFVKEALPEAKVTTASSGEEALQLAKDLGQPFDLAIIDYNMEGLDGIETAEKLIEIQAILPRRCVICTANQQNILADRIADIGILYLPKPLTFDKFRHLLNTLDIQAS